MNFHLVKVKSYNRYLIATVDDVNDVIDIIEDQYIEPITYLEDKSYKEFEDAVYYDNKYENGLYMIEGIDSVNVYKIKTIISFGYLFNSAKREIQLIDRYEIVVDE